MIVSNPVFITLASSGAVFVIMGLIMLKNPPRKINDFYGYRTPRSRKSQAHWDFAQRYSSKLMSRVGQVLLIGSVPMAFLNIDRVFGIPVAIGLLILSALYLIFSTEKAIREKFPPTKL